jgi:hypothetical protein
MAYPPDPVDVLGKPQQARKALVEYSSQYRDWDEKEKKAKENKDQLRSLILSLISEVVLEEVILSEQTIAVGQDKDPREFVAKQYPGWVIVNMVFLTAGELDAEEGYWKVTIQEDPRLVKYEFEFDGMKFGRTTSSKKPTFDAERLWKEREDLRSIIREEITTTYVLDETKASRAIVDDSSLMEVFRDYWTIPAPEPRLLPFTPVKEGE